MVELGLKSRPGHFQTEGVSMTLHYVLIIYRESHNPDPSWMITYTEEIGLHGKHLHLCWLKKKKEREVCKTFEPLIPKGCSLHAGHRGSKELMLGGERGRSYFDCTWDSPLPSKSFFPPAEQIKITKEMRSFLPCHFEVKCSCFKRWQ